MLISIEDDATGELGKFAADFMQECYLPRLRLLDYGLKVTCAASRPEEDFVHKLRVYSHAPIDISILRGLVVEFGLHDLIAKFRIDSSTTVISDEDLITVIERCNEKFRAEWCGW